MKKNNNLLKVMLSGIIVFSIAFYFQSCQMNGKVDTEKQSMELVELNSPQNPEPHEIVGELIGGNPVLTIDSANLITVFTDRLFEESGIQGNFNTISLSHYPNESGSYLLVFEGPLYKASLIGYDYANGGVVNIAIDTKTSCVTKDCVQESLGCAPMNGGGCWECANKGDCTKTVTTTSLFNYY